MAETVACSSDIAPTSQFDLSQKMFPFLDRHLSLLIVEWLGNTDLYAKVDILHAQHRLTSSTLLIDTTIEICESLHGKGTEEADRAVAEIESRRASVLEDLTSKTEACSDLLDETKDDDKRALIANKDRLETLYSLCKLNFEAGQYETACKRLQLYLSLSGKIQTLTHSKELSAYWGILAGSALTGDWNDAMTAIEKLKELIEKDQKSSHAERLHMRGWLLHFSTFVFAGKSDFRAKLCELFLEERYLQTIQIVCPWLFRYLAAFAIVAKQHRFMEMRNIVKILAVEIAEGLDDPFCKFLVTVLDEFDFDAARAMLPVLQQVVEGDYFLSQEDDRKSLPKDLWEMSRRLLFDAFVRIHNRISLPDLAEQLGVTGEVLERWLMLFVGSSGYDVKVDCDEQTASVQMLHPSTYQVVLDKTQDLLYRTEGLADRLPDRLRREIAGHTGSADRSHFKY